ncbi:MAG: acyl carrier protein, partial [Gammaproteobacteria bacterium]|nr:acyl carrier protein [Gammaproteobacteria bacterium]
MTVHDRLARIFQLQFGVMVPPDGDMGAETDGAWDSLAHINLILAVEPEVGVVLCPEAAGRATSCSARRTRCECRT